MSLPRLALPSLALLLLAACAAQPKALRSSTDVIDGAAARAEPPPAPAAEPTRAPGTCVADSDCEAGQGCDSGRCVARAACEVVRVHFGFDSAALDASAMKGLQDTATCLQSRRVADLTIEGHCDERGTSAYNLALGAKRAEAVKKYLADLGVTTRLDTISFGKELPAVQGSGEAAWAENRRAELKLPGEARSDGQKVAGR
jgi:outer membrane protein OmpA-like peptidoglycan-associated protein